MNVTFRLRFATQFGQSLWLTGSRPLPGHAVALQFRDANHWQTSIPLVSQVKGEAIEYSYQLRDTNGRQTTDWGRDRRLVPGDFNCTELLVLDSWNHPGLLENAFYTAPFQKVLLTNRFTEIKNTPPAFPTHTFRVKTPLLEKARHFACSAKARPWATGNRPKPSR
jgi:4-alpha-glucanotransferase